MVVGLGTGSTAALFVDALGQRIAEDGLRIAGIATSEQTAAQARSLKLPLTSFAEHAQADLTVDGTGTPGNRSTGAERNLSRKLRPSSSTIPPASATRAFVPCAAIPRADPGVSTLPTRCGDATFQTCATWTPAL